VFAEIPRLRIICSRLSVKSPTQRDTGAIRSITQSSAPTHHHALQTLGSSCQRYRTTGELVPAGYPNNSGLPRRFRDKPSRSTRCRLIQRRGRYSVLTSVAVPWARGLSCKRSLCFDPGWDGFCLRRNILGPAG
jgi:ribosomal protein L36